MKVISRGSADDPDGPFGIYFQKSEKYPNAPLIEVRGIGKSYNEFYKWLHDNNVKPIWEHSDWPWHIMVLTSYDLSNMMANWAPYMYYNGDDGYLEEDDASST